MAGLIPTLAAGRLAGLLKACHRVLHPLLDPLVVAGELPGLQRELLGPRRGRPLGHALREGHGSTECEGSLSFLESPSQLEKIRKIRQGAALTYAMLARYDLPNEAKIE